MTRFVLATANPAKAREINEILRSEWESLEVIPLDPGWPVVAETGSTLEANARLKATAAVARAKLPALADDTGLAVDALAGAPGVRSARFAGDNATDRENITYLLERLIDVAPLNRRARFTTVAMAAWPDGKTVVASGSVEGVIAVRAVGTEGFGYDPVFIPTEGDGRTFAQMPAAEKQQLSHRGRAFRALAKKLLPSEPTV